MLDAGDRDAFTAKRFIDDLANRLSSRIQLTSDGLKLYVNAVEDVFGANLVYAQLVKIYGETSEGQKRCNPAECVGCERRAVTGNPDPNHISTSYVERHNLSVRITVRRD